MIRLNNRGAILGMVLICTIIITIFGYGLLQLSCLNAIQMNKAVRSADAFWIAEAGTQKAVGMLRTDHDYYMNPVNIPSTIFGDGAYSVIVNKPGGNLYTITSTGTRGIPGAVNYVTRTIETQWRDSSFNNALLGGSNKPNAIQISGVTSVDSYDSTRGGYNVSGNRGQNGDVGTNGDIQISGSTSIGGDVATGVRGSFEDTSDEVSGNVTHDTHVTLPAVVVPTLSWASLPTITNNATNSIPAGNYAAQSISISGTTVVTLTGPTNIHLTGVNSMNISGVASIKILGADPVIIYADGNISVSGVSIINTSQQPSNLQIYGCGTGSINLSGVGDFYGVIYAPQEALNISGVSNLYGSFIGNTFNVSGVTSVHYDESLSQISSPIYYGMPSRVSWQEK
jgi:hypothetical protein